MSKIMLFNATGMQGTTIANRLLQRGYSVVAPVRSKEKLAALKHKGIDSFLTDFNMKDLEGELSKVDKVVLQIPAQVSPSVMVQLSENIINAIKNAGSPPTIFVISSTVPQSFTGKEGPDARLRMKNSALELIPNAIIFSATEYLENFSTSYRQAIDSDGMIPQTIPARLPVNYLSWEDLASYVLGALECENIEGGFYPIGGNEGITGEELALRLGKVIGKELRYQPLTHQQLSDFLIPVVGKQLAMELAEFYEWQDLTGYDLLSPDTSKLRDLLEIKLPDFEQWAMKAFGV